MANPHLPPSPGEEKKGLLSPTYFLGCVEIVSVRIHYLPQGSNPACPPYSQEYPLLSSSHSFQSLLIVQRKGRALQE